VFRDAPLNDGILSQGPPPFTHDIFFVFPLYPVPYSLVYTLRGDGRGMAYVIEATGLGRASLHPTTVGIVTRATAADRQTGSQHTSERLGRSSRRVQSLCAELCCLGPSTYKGACVESSGAVCQHRVVDVRRPTSTDVRVLFYRIASLSSAVLYIL
jgi:hypothetical protein